MVWTLFCASLTLGMGLGYGAYNWPKFGIIIISMFSGAIMGTLIYTVFFGRLDNLSDKSYIE